MTTLPLSITKLLIGFFSQSLTLEQHEELDAWICESEANQQIFGDCLEITLLPKIYHPDYDDFEMEAGTASPN